VAAEDPRTVAPVQPSGERPIRAAEVVGALSLATDLGTGQPLEHALRTAVLAVRLGGLAGASTHLRFRGPSTPDQPMETVGIEPTSAVA
jgi:hypothetical protein